MSKARQVAAVVVPILFVAGGLYYGWKSKNPREGDSCKGDVGVCLDPKTMLSCEDGKYVPDPCRGPAGCKDNRERIDCDQSVAETGDRCFGPGATCSVDGRRMLDCKDDVLVERRNCRGPYHCTTKDEIVTCDTSVARLGDSCAGEGTAACTEDHKSMLLCHDEKLELGRICRGSTPCTSEHGTVDCDLWLAEEGDSCSGDTGACTLDLKTYLECKDGKFVLTARCSACGLEGENVACSDPVPVQ
jgi:hypothetical protein